MKLKVSKLWTAEERVTLATALLCIVQSDLMRGSYGRVGQPNIQSVLHLLNEPAEVLEPYRLGITDIISKSRRDVPNWRELFE